MGTTVRVLFQSVHTPCKCAPEGIPRERTFIDTCLHDSNVRTVQEEDDVSLIAGDRLCDEGSLAECLDGCSKVQAGGWRDGESGA